MKPGGSARARFWFRLLGALILLLAPLILLAIAHRLWLRRRALVGLMAKLTGRGVAVPQGATLIHGVSLGEVALMKPLLARLPLDPVVLTTSTETGWAGLEKSFPQRPRTVWPFDLPWAVAAFVRRTRPRQLLLLEGELWPLMLLACRAHGIPVTVLNARASQRSHARWRRLRPFARRLVGSLHLAICQNGLYAARMRDLGCRQVRVTGSLKADMVTPAEAQAARAEAARLGLGDGPLFLIASTSDGEESALLRTWQAHAPAWPCVVVPRHPERGPALVELCRSLGASARRSTVPGEGQVVIVDEIGRLAPLYRLCADRGGLAIVGGSLGSGRGGQNMLEAAAPGCCTVVGWDTRAQPDPMHLLRQADAVVELQPGTLDQQVADLVADAQRRQALGQRAQTAWLGGRGALQRTIRHLASAPPIS